MADHPAYDIFNKEPVLSTALDTRMRAIADEVGFPIRMTVEEAEEVIRILWEFVGHMGADVGEAGYEFHLIERARHWAAQNTDRDARRHRTCRTAPDRACGAERESRAPDVIQQCGRSILNPLPPPRRPARSYP